MRFIAAADLHITDQRPQNRKDDYTSSCLRKFDELCKAVSLTKSKLLVVAGDFFDSPHVPYEITRQVIQITKKYKIKILVVPGQHDLRYHKKGLKNTPLGVLESAKIVTILSNKKVTKVGTLTFIGGGWEEEPKVHADVLVIHQMVTESGPLWDGQTDYVSSRNILNKKYPWATCVISGDNHKPHIFTQKKRLQVNCGSMMRKSKDQIDYTPSYVTLNICKKVAKGIFKPYTIEPAEDVFDFDRIQREEILQDAKKEAKEMADKSMNKFISSLPGDLADRPEFKTVLKKIVKDRKPNERVKNLITEIMEKVS